MDKKVKRISWIDIAKGIGIILVLAGHTFTEGQFYVWLNSFHMPLFFLLAGILCNPNNSNIKFDVRKKIINFMVPFIIFLGVQFVFWILVDHNYHDFNMGPIWFLLGILGVELLAVATIKITANNEIRIPAACLIYAGLHSGLTPLSDNCLIIRPLLIVLGGVVFYLIGTMLHALIFQKKFDETVNKKKSLSLCFIALIGLLSFWTANQNGIVNIYKNTYHNYGWFYFNALIGSLFVIGVSIILWYNTLLEFLGRNTIIILGTHNQVKLVIMVVMGRIFDVPVNILRNSAGGGTATIVLTLAIEVLIIYVFRIIKKHLKNTKMDSYIRFVR